MADTSQAPSSPLQRPNDTIEPQTQPNVDGGVSLDSPSGTMLDSSNYRCSPGRGTRLRSGSSSRGEEGDGDGCEMRQGEELIVLSGESEVEDDAEEREEGVKLEKPMGRDAYMSEPALVCCPHPRLRFTHAQMQLSRNRISQPLFWPSTIAPSPTIPQTRDQTALPSTVPRTGHRRARQYVSLADRPQVDPTALDFQVPGRAYMSDDWRMDQELHSRKADEAEQRKRSKS
nr:hypothetical protein B0A51_09987 [Rachicladosporium sp. CCFEE 5018]